MRADDEEFGRKRVVYSRQWLVRVARDCHRKRGIAVQDTKRLIAVILLLLPISAQADALFGNEMAGDTKLPRTWGIGIDYFAMQQPYQVDSLSFTPPILPITDPSILDIENDLRHNDLKVDVWLFPFLNVFGLYGTIDGDTTIDLGALGIPLPADVSNLTVDYNGDVFGGGMVLVVGGDRWFATVTGTFTDTSLTGDYKSSIEATTIQPRLGLRFGDHTEFWVGGYIIDAKEKHSGTIDLDLGPIIAPPGGPIPRPVPLEFAVDLSQAEDFNLSFGTHMMFNDAWEATVEVGGGDRSTVLANITYRFE
jgi:hypothetical protein